jgi:hypothetical protein
MAQAIHITVVWDATSYGMVDSYQIRRRHFPKYHNLHLQITVGILDQAIPNIRLNTDAYVFRVLSTPKRPCRLCGLTRLPLNG